MKIKTVVIYLFFLAGASFAEPEPLDMEFLEWLGQVTEVEELGVDINGLLEAQEQQTQSESDEENSK